MLRLGSLTLGDAPRIAVPLTDVEWRALPPDALRRADVVELRVDLFARRDSEHVADICREAAASGKPVIATVRWSAEGGGAGLSDDQRRALYTVALAHAAAVDVELRSPLCDDIVARARAAGVAAIVSHHDFAQTPPAAALDTMVAEASERGADIVKIAAHAATPADRNRLLDLLRRHCDRPMIAIAMGPAGAASRVFFPLCGSLLTYGFLNHAVAPGQMSLRDLREALDRYGP